MLSSLLIVLFISRNCLIAKTLPGSESPFTVLKLYVPRLQLVFNWTKQFFLFFFFLFFISDFLIKNNNNNEKEVEAACVRASTVREQWHCKHTVR